MLSRVLAIVPYALCDVCACPSHAGIVSKRLHGSRWFLRVPSTYPILCFQDIAVHIISRLISPHYIRQVNGVNWRDIL